MEGSSRSIGLKEYQAIDQMYGCHGFLSEKEKMFLEADEVEPSLSIQFFWRYECCAVLLWALSLYDLNGYDELCDVAAMAQTIRSFSLVEAMCEAAVLRSEEELLDMHTRVLYYD